MCVLTRHSASVFMRCDGDSGAHVAGGGGGGGGDDDDDCDDDDNGDGEDRVAQHTKVCIIAVLLLRALGCDGT
jgi:hypothetical protein